MFGIFRYCTGKVLEGSGVGPTCMGGPTWTWVVGARPHTPGQGAPRSPLRRNKIISRRDKIKIPKKGDNNRWGREMMGFLSSHLCQRPNGLGGQETSPSTPIYSGEAHESYTRSSGTALPLSLLLLSHGAWRSPAGVPCSSATTTPSCCCWTESSPPLSLSPCWIKAWETSSGCTCVERGGAVRSALDHR